MGRSVGIDSARSLSQRFSVTPSESAIRCLRSDVCEGCIKKEDDAERSETTQLLDRAANDSCKTAQRLVPGCGREIPSHQRNAQEARLEETVVVVVPKS